MYNISTEDILKQTVLPNVLVINKRLLPDVKRKYLQCAVALLLASCCICCLYLSIIPKWRIEHPANFFIKLKLGETSGVSILDIIYCYIISHVINDGLELFYSYSMLKKIEKGFLVRNNSSVVFHIIGIFFLVAAVLLPYQYTAYSMLPFIGVLLKIYLFHTGYTMQVKRKYVPEGFMDILEQNEEIPEEYVIVPEIYLIGNNDMKSKNT